MDAWFSSKPKGKLSKKVWWRWDSYAIVDGCIQGENSSKLYSYDPREEHEKAMRRRGSETLEEFGSPYAELMTLVSRVENAIRGTDGLDKVQKIKEREIKRWCGKFGLLGILPHDMLSVTTQASSAEPDPTTPSRRTPPGYQTTYWRSGATWRAVSRLDELVALENQRPYAVLGAYADAVHEVPLDDPEWTKYFVSGARAGCPKPLSEDFWRVYREPVAEFYDRAKLFSNVVETLASFKTKRGALVRDERLDIRAAMRHLEHMMSGLAPVLGTNGQEYRREWESPSLLCMLADTAVKDVIVGKASILRCDACQELFRPRRKRDPRKNQYCGPNCSSREAMRRMRSRN